MFSACESVEYVFCVLYPIVTVAWSQSVLPENIHGVPSPALHVTLLHASGAPSHSLATSKCCRDLNKNQTAGEAILDAIDVRCASTENPKPQGRSRGIVLCILGRACLANRGEEVLPS